MCPSLAPTASLDNGMHCVPGTGLRAGRGRARVGNRLLCTFAALVNQPFDRGQRQYSEFRNIRDRTDKQDNNGQYES